MIILLNNLNNKYKDFIYRIFIQLNEISNFNRFVTFFHEKDRFFKRDIKKVIMIAIIKKFNKKQKNKKKKKQ